MINEINIKGWDNKIVNHPKVVYPQCNDSGAPRNYFVSLFVGARGSGKTYLLTKLLKTFEEKKCYKDGEEVPQRIVLISPTAHSDSNVIFKSLKNLDWDIDVLTEYSDEILKDKIKEIKKDIDEAKEYKEYEKCYKKFKKVSIDKLTDDECELLYKYDFEKFEDIPEPKYPRSGSLYSTLHTSKRSKCPVAARKSSKSYPNFPDCIINSHPILLFKKIPLPIT